MKNSSRSLYDCAMSGLSDLSGLSELHGALGAATLRSSYVDEENLDPCSWDGEAEYDREMYNQSFD